jgi:hypothetical protein
MVSGPWVGESGDEGLPRDCYRRFSPLTRANALKGGLRFAPLGSGSPVRSCEAGTALLRCSSRAFPEPRLRSPAGRASLTHPVTRGLFSSAPRSTALCACQRPSGPARRCRRQAKGGPPAPVATPGPTALGAQRYPPGLGRHLSGEHYRVVDPLHRAGSRAVADSTEPRRSSRPRPTLCCDWRGCGRKRWPPAFTAGGRPAGSVSGRGAVRVPITQR